MIENTNTAAGTFVRFVKFSTRMFKHRGPLTTLVVMSKFAELPASMWSWRKMQDELSILFLQYITCTDADMKLDEWTACQHLKSPVTIVYIQLTSDALCDIWVIKCNLSLKCQGNGQGQNWWSHLISSFFVALHYFYLRYSKSNIWPRKFKVKIMAKATFEA